MYYCPNPHLLTLSEEKTIVQIHCVFWLVAPPNSEHINEKGGKYEHQKTSLARLVNVNSCLKSIACGINLKWQLVHHRRTKKSHITISCKSSLRFLLLTCISFIFNNATLNFYHEVLENWSVYELDNILYGASIRSQATTTSQSQSRLVGNEIGYVNHKYSFNSIWIHFISILDNLRFSCTTLPCLSYIWKLFPCKHRLSLRNWKCKLVNHGVTYRIKFLNNWYESNSFLNYLINLMRKTG